MEDIQKYNAKIFFMGSDWRGHFDDLKSTTQVIYFDRTPNISSTYLRNIQNMDSEKYSLELFKKYSAERKIKE